MTLRHVAVVLDLDGVGPARGLADRHDDGLGAGVARGTAGQTEVDERKHVERLLLGRHLALERRVAGFVDRVRH